MSISEAVLQTAQVFRQDRSAAVVDVDPTLNPESSTKSSSISTQQAMRLARGKLLNGSPCIIPLAGT